MLTKKYKIVNASILFCDIRGFTSLFDSKDPVEAFSFANYVLSSLGNVILEYGGAIDKLMGDGLLAHFGVLNSCSDHAMKACYCSLKLIDEITKINCNRYYLNKSMISLGIGINTGDVAHGKITAGSFEELSVYGDTVNTAARIEYMTKFFSIDTLVSKTTFDLCKNNLEFFIVGKHDLKGKKEKYPLFWLLPTN